MDASAHEGTGVDVELAHALHSRMVKGKFADAVDPKASLFMSAMMKHVISQLLNGSSAACAAAAAAPAAGGGAVQPGRSSDEGSAEPRRSPKSSRPCIGAGHIRDAVRSNPTLRALAMRQHAPEDLSLRASGNASGAHAALAAAAAAPSGASEGALLCDSKRAPDAAPAVERARKRARGSTQALGVPRGKICEQLRSIVCTVEGAPGARRSAFARGLVAAVRSCADADVETRFAGANALCDRTLAAAAKANPAQFLLTNQVHAATSVFAELRHCAALAPSRRAFCVVEGGPVSCLVPMLRWHSTTAARRAGGGGDGGAAAQRELSTFLEYYRVQTTRVSGARASRVDVFVAPSLDALSPSVAAASSSDGGGAHSGGDALHFALIVRACAGDAVRKAVVVQLEGTALELHEMWAYLWLLVEVCSGRKRPPRVHTCAATDAAVVGEFSFMYRYILRESCSQFDSLPLPFLTPSQSARSSSPRRTSCASAPRSASAAAAAARLRRQLHRRQRRRGRGRHRRRHHNRPRSARRMMRRAGATCGASGTVPGGGESRSAAASGPARASHSNV